MARPQEVFVKSVGLTELNPELSPDDALVDIVFVHGLGGNARGTWTYKGPKKDSNSYGSQKEVVDRPSMNEAQAANVTDRSIGTAEVIGQSQSQITQEEQVVQEEPTRRSFSRLLKKTIPGISSPSRSKSRVKAQTQSQRGDAKREAAAKEHVFFWPQNLPEACARARIMTFGYDSEVTKFFGGAANQNTFYDHAGNLLGALVRKRLHADTRPIIFVAHSLGGLVVKQMLFEAERSRAIPERCKVHASTKALFFLGTPHRGSDWTQWGEIARGLAAVIFDTNSSSIKHLKVNGEPLMQLQRNFENLIWLRTFWIYTFIEAEGFKPVPLLNAKIVKAEHAKAGDPGRERVETISANHNAMCRFWGTEDPNYEQVACELNRFVHQNIVQVEADVNQTRVCEYQKFQLLWSLPGLTDIKAVEEKSRQEGQSNQYDSVDSMYTASLTLQSAAVLESLDYEGRRDRENQLWEIDTNPQTVRWVWASTFADWASKEDALFWIRGKPASGKSTLMEYMARGDELKTHLRQGIGEDWTIVHHFFFDYGVTKDVRNNFEGFLRSLLYQLIDRSQGGELSSPGIEAEQRWSLRELKERLALVLKKRSNPICILLDGLDEYQDDKWGLASFLREIADSRVKLCVASRPDTVLDTAFEDLPTIKMQDWNTPAIEKMVDLKIQGPMAGSGFNNDEVVELAKGISDKADGVFLWARFAIDELRNGWSEGLDLVGLQKRLENVPERLEDIYARIFRRIKLEQRQQAAHMLQLVCYAKRTLTLDELYVATAHAAGGQGPLVKQIRAVDIRQFKKRILAVTGGVLEVFHIRKKIHVLDDSDLHKSKETDKVMVNVIHRTVRTYLDSSGWSQVLDAKHEGMLHAEVLWLRICAGFFPPSFTGLQPIMDDSLNLSRLRGPFDKPSPSSTEELSPLLEYAARFMLDHAAEVEHDLGLHSYKMLHPSMSDSFFGYHQSYRSDRDPCAMLGPKPLHPLHLAITHGLDGYVKDILPILSEKISLGSDEWNNIFSLELEKWFSYGNPRMSLLGFAICHADWFHPNNAAQTRIVAILLDRYSRAHDAEMILALQRSPAEVVKLLLPYWQDGKMVLHSENSSSDLGFRAETLRSDLWIYCQKRFDIGPMWYIARRSRYVSRKDSAELIDLFVRRGEDINDQCGPFGTALHGALQRVNSDGEDPYMWKLLVAKGADVNASGPFGTPLESVWRLANTAKIEDDPSHFKNAIHWLIENGAVNNRCDPNGSVPSREQMLSFREWGNEWGKKGWHDSERMYRGDPIDKSWSDAATNGSDGHGSDEGGSDGHGSDEGGSDGNEWGKKGWHDSERMYRGGPIDKSWSDAATNGSDGHGSDEGGSDGNEWGKKGWHDSERMYRGDPIEESSSDAWTDESDWHGSGEGGSDGSM